MKNEMTLPSGRKIFYFFFWGKNPPGFWADGRGRSVGHVGKQNPLHAVRGEGYRGGRAAMTTVHLFPIRCDGRQRHSRMDRSELTIHHDRAYQVMTNEPRFEDQLRHHPLIGGAIDGKRSFSPDQARAEDPIRSGPVFLINAIPQNQTIPVEAAASGL